MKKEKLIKYTAKSGLIFKYYSHIRGSNIIHNFFYINPFELLKNIDYTNLI